MINYKIGMPVLDRAIALGIDPMTVIQGMTEQEAVQQVSMPVEMPSEVPAMAPPIASLPAELPQPGMQPQILPPAAPMPSIQMDGQTLMSMPSISDVTGSNFGAAAPAAPKGRAMVMPENPRYQAPANDSYRSAAAPSRGPAPMGTLPSMDLPMPGGQGPSYAQEQAAVANAMAQMNQAPKSSIPELQMGSANSEAEEAAIQQRRANLISQVANVWSMYS
jgi:hypothetical protein